jgi:pimeloyl-ACP methyl ester carboxylesterase
MDVLITRGGSAGLAAVFLQRHGIIATVAGCTPGILIGPRAAGVPPRTAELLREAGPFAGTSAMMSPGRKAASEGAVSSADGTTIGYRRMGAGPGLVVVHGTMRSADDYTRLAGYLADHFTVYLVDRRGRGASGPQAPDYSFLRESEDLAAVLRQTGARLLFGHSFGGAVCLEAALEYTPARLALYEPAVSTGGAISADMLRAVAAALEAGSPGRALAAAFSVMSDQDAQFPGLLRAVLSVPVLARAVFATPPGRRLRGLLATVPAEGRLVRGADGTYGKYSRITSETLLIHGTQSAPWLIKATVLLAQTIPHATTVTLDGIGHNGPCEDAPDKVADALREFFAEALPTRAASPA